MGEYSGEDVLRMAMQLEESGRMFYETVARRCEDLEVAGLCLQLSGEEKSHYDKFRQIRQALTQPSASSQRFAMGGSEFVDAMLGGRVVPVQEEAEDVAKDGTVAEILDMADRMEKDSISFYTDLVQAVDQRDAPAVQKIIAEEQVHSRLLAEVRGQAS